MNHKILSLLIVAEKALFADALRAQLEDSLGFSPTCVNSADIRSLDVDTVSALDLAVVIGPNAVDHEDLLRSNFYRGPVLQLASADETEVLNTVVRLPVRMSVLFQKLRSLVSSYWFRDDLVLEIGHLKLRPAFKELLREGEGPIALTDKEVEILIFLYRAGRKIISRDVLLAEIWGYNAEVSTHTLETHIYRLRQKIETDPDVSTVLITEPGGYRLAAGRE